MIESDDPLLVQCASAIVSINQFANLFSPQALAPQYNDINAKCSSIIERVFGSTNQAFQDFKIAFDSLNPPPSSPPSQVVPPVPVALPPPPPPPLSGPNLGEQCQIDFIPILAGITLPSACSAGRSFNSWMNQVANAETTSEFSTCINSLSTEDGAGWFTLCNWYASIS